MDRSTFTPSSTLKPFVIVSRLASWGQPWHLPQFQTKPEYHLDRHRSPEPWCDRRVRRPYHWLVWECWESISTIIECSQSWPPTWIAFPVTCIHPHPMVCHHCCPWRTTNPAVEQLNPTCFSLLAISVQVSVNIVTRLFNRVTSWSFKSLLKEDLMEGPTISVKDRNEQESTYSEAGDLVVDHLLLGYPPSCESGSM